MTHTHVILDGLSDPLIAQALSRRWADAGFDNTVDPAGQAASLAPRPTSGGTDAAPETLDEGDIHRAAAIARGFALELRDRAGESFIARNTLATMHDRMEYEYRSRLATALMFFLPALALHYLAPMLAGGGGADTGAMFFPWLFELLLVGWATLAAAWPILWQGGLAFITLRATSDLFTSVLLLIAFIPSTVGVAGMLFGVEPFFGVRGPAFHVAGMAVVIAVAQRWLIYRNIEHLAGRGMLMLLRFGRLVSAWIIVATIVWITGEWFAALALLLLLPPMASHAGINPWTPGWAALLPMFAFALLMLIDPVVADVSLASVRIEVAGGFALVQTLVMALGWRKIPKHLERGS